MSFFLLEATGKPLEKIDAFFELPWYKIDRQGRTVSANTAVSGETNDEFGKNAEKEANPHIYLEKADKAV